MISDKRIFVFYFKFLFFRFLVGIFLVCNFNSMQRTFPAKSEKKKKLYNFNKKKVQVVVPWLRHKEAECKSRPFFRGSSCSAKPSAFIFLKFQLRMGQHFAAFPEQRKTLVARYSKISTFHSTILLSEFSSYHWSQIQLSFGATCVIWKLFKHVSITFFQVSNVP